MLASLGESTASTPFTQSSPGFPSSLRMGPSPVPTLFSSSRATVHRPSRISPSLRFFGFLRSRGTNHQSEIFNDLRIAPVLPHFRKLFLFNHLRIAQFASTLF